MIEALQLASYKFFTVFFRVILDYKSNIFRYRTINQWAGEENSSKDICPKADYSITLKSKQNQKKPITVGLLMTESKKQPPEFRTSGTLSEKGVVVADQSNIDALTSRGYGTMENGVFTLTFYEALYLNDKGMLEVKGEGPKTVDFQTLLHCYEAKNENAWASFLVYRDLRSRGYVAREGFGTGI